MIQGQGRQVVEEEGHPRMAGAQERFIDGQGAPVRGLCPVIGRLLPGPKVSQGIEHAGRVARVIG